MTTKKIGLVLSHFFVREGEEKKFNWISSAVNKYNELNVDFFYVLSGHGVYPPDSIIKKFDKIIWQDSIKEKELGRGHPHFCIKGFKACKDASCEMTLKNRAYDYVTSNKFFDKNLVVSEQTSLNSRIIGDLFLYGETDYLLNWWTRNDWDYSVDGLNNLYRNMPDDFLSKAVYANPEYLGWKTFEDDCDCYWGHHKNYHWYGGDGINEIDIT